MYGIPGQSRRRPRAVLADALALEPEHLSCYELEAKPGTRFTHTHGTELHRQAEVMEDYFERVVDTLTGRRATAGTRRRTSAATTRPASSERDTT